MGRSESKAKKALLKLLKNTFSDLVQCEEVDVKESYRLPDKKVKVHIGDYPFQINLYPDGKALHLYPEQTLKSSDENSEPKRYILFDPESYYSRISGFYRIEEGEKITLGGDDIEQQDFLNISNETPQRKLSISNDDGSLIFKSHVPNPKSCIAPLLKDKKVNLVVNWRQKKLQRLRDIFGGPIQCLPEPEALSLIREVNGILEDEAYRPKDKSGQPGGIIALPAKLQVFIVGDLHTKYDNLLTILSQNHFLEGLEDGSACLLILGDAIHCEEPGHYDEMQTSLLMMDLIFKLKVRFPNQVFYLRGNHDSFSEDISKGGIPQGILWENELKKSRGKSYLNEMNRCYQLLPYVAFSDRFIACHAAAPTSSVSKDALVNIKDNPKLIQQVINNRLRKPNRPAGYSKRDIKRFRKCLNVSEKTPVIVGHTPMSMDETLWERVGEIDDHFVAYAANNDWVGVMAQIQDRLYPLRYPVEPVAAIINSLPN